jgi:O-antigen ligase
LKWAFFAIAVLSLLPLSAWLRQNSGQSPKIWVGIGILLYVVDPLHLYMAVVSWAYWPGFVKGIELTIIDLLCVSILFSTPRSRISSPFWIIAAAYLASVLISAFQAGVPEAALFYAWQLIRMFLVFYATTKACAQDERVAPALLKGMAIGICIELCVGIWQRFGIGAIQIWGTFGHQNALGMAINFAIFPLFALWLAGKRGWEFIIGPLAGAAIAIMTASRATIGLCAAGLALTFLISAVRHWTSRKGLFALTGLLLLALLVPAAIGVLDSRFAAQPLSDEYDERAVFQSVALAILQDHPMGVGANNYVVAANTQGYNERAGVAPAPGSLNAHVHNVYLVAAAETGYIGLIAFVLLLAQPMFMAFLAGRRSRYGRAGDLLLGLGVSLLITSIHSFFEWILVTYHLQYFLAVQSGMIAGTVQRVRSARVTAKGSVLHSSNKEVRAVIG